MPLFSFCASFVPSSDVGAISVTSNVARVYPFQALLPSDDTGLPMDSKAQAEQVRSVAVQRIGAQVGALTGAGLASLDEALRLHLAL